jgi:ComF family protein
MRKAIISIKNFALDVLFPKFCVNCGKEGNYICEDCLGLIKIAKEQFCPFCKPLKIVLDGKTCAFCRKYKKLSGLFCATDYKNPLVKKMLKLFKYKSLVRDMALPLCSFIITHFELSNKTLKIDFVIPVPAHRAKLKRRGFNPAQEIAAGLAKFLKKPLLLDALIKTKPTLAQTELKHWQERAQNVRGAFICEKSELLAGKRVLLVDDIFTTGATMEECAKILKQTGVREIWGAVVARG